MKHRSTAVASAAIEKALRGEAFQVSDLQRALTDPPSRQTIYRVLRQLKADDWLTVDGHTWRPALKTQALADVDDDRNRDDSRGFDLDAEALLGK